MILNSIDGFLHYDISPSYLYPFDPGPERSQDTQNAKFEQEAASIVSENCSHPKYILARSWRLLGPGRKYGLHYSLFRFVRGSSRIGRWNRQRHCAQVLDRWRRRNAKGWSPRQPFDWSHQDFVDPPISRSWTSAMVTVRELYERMNVRLFDRWHLGAPKTDKFVHLYRRGKGV